MYERHKMFDDVAEALNDQGLTVGAKVEWDAPHLLAGNMSSDDPALSTLMIDDLGRMWKERHHGEAHELVCVFDLRTLHPPMVVPADFDFDAGDANAPGYITWRKSA